MKRGTWLNGIAKKHIAYCDTCGSSNLCHCVILGGRKVEVNHDIVFFEDSFIWTPAREEQAVNRITRYEEFIKDIRIEDISIPSLIIRKDQPFRAGL